MKSTFKTAAIIIFCSIISINVNAQNENFKHRSTPQGLSYLEQAPHTLTLTDTINAPIATVWKAITDYSTYPLWFNGVEKCYSPSTPQTGLHSKRIVEVQGFKFYEDIILWEEEKAYGFTLLETNRKIYASGVEALYFEAIDENTTKVIYKGGFEYAGILSLWVWISV